MAHVDIRVPIEVALLGQNRFFGSLDDTCREREARLI